MTNTILSQNEEDRCWSLYLAVVSNPFAEAVTYEEFKSAMKPKKKIKYERKSFAKNSQIKEQVLKASKILSGFKPY